MVRLSSGRLVWYVCERGWTDVIHRKGSGILLCISGCCSLKILNTVWISDSCLVPFILLICTKVICLTFLLEITLWTVVWGNWQPMYEICLSILFFLLVNYIVSFCFWVIGNYIRSLFSDSCIASSVWIVCFCNGLSASAMLLYCLKERFSTGLSFFCKYIILR